MDVETQAQGQGFDAALWKAVSLTHVEYPRGDVVGYCLAWISLLPIFTVVSMVTVIACKRDLHTICYLLGILINEGINWVLKHIIKDSRPVSGRVLHVKYGMPSSHSQFMWFFSTYLALFLLIRIKRNQNVWDEWWKYLMTAGGIIVSVLVSYSRVYLLYHSTSQVVWGAVVGAVLGLLWFICVHLLFTPLFPVIASWPLSEFLMIRDLTLIPNVIWFEYTTSRAEARSRLKNRKIRSQ